MNDQPAKRPPPAQHREMSDRAVAFYLVLVAVVCVGGYFFLMKLIHMSQEEDCILGGRPDCASIQDR
ncbi:MAG TPA: hypothetical protein VFB45_24925 [Pseudolabrys sp.]|nr:hypothetical protein [Pseudolabrys sp.]